MSKILIFPIKERDTLEHSVVSEIVRDLVLRGELDGDLDCFRGGYLDDGSLIFVLLLDQLIVKVVEVHRKRKLEGHFSKRLAQTDSSTSQEGCKGVMAASAAIWSLEIGALRVKAFWNELRRLDPL